MAKDFNQYFGHITNSLVTYEFPSEKCERLHETENIAIKFNKHRSIMKIKKHCKFKKNVSSRLAIKEETKTKIKKAVNKDSAEI